MLDLISVVLDQNRRVIFDYIFGGRGKSADKYYYEQGEELAAHLDYLKFFLFRFLENYLRIYRVRCRWVFDWLLCGVQKIESNGRHDPTVVCFCHSPFIVRLADRRAERLCLSG